MAPRWRPRHTMYLAASLSAWGDRMWTFAVGLYMVYATPDSLRLTAIYGLVISVSVIALGATVGRWVDTTDRLRAAQLSLLVQNSAVCCCAVLLIVGLQYADYAASTWRGWLQIALQVLVILIADVAALATEANKITIEKDWVVVMARGDQDALAWMNSAFRTIDLGTFILAPVLVGQLMTFLSPVAAAGFMAGWNVISLAVEYSLLRVVYRSVPQLSHPKQADPGDDDDGRPSTSGTAAAAAAGMGSGNKVAELQPLGGGQLPMEVPASLEPRASVEVPATVHEDMEVPTVEVNGAVDAAAAGGQAPSQAELPGTSASDGSVVAVSPGITTSPTAASPPPKSAGCCHWLGKRLSDMKRGWTVYFRSDFCLAGLALASLYMTVLGFDNITAGYGYTQGLTESTLSLLTGAGAFAGICGSLTFPKLRHTVGPTRAGIIGFSLAVLAQSLSLASVFLPGTAFWPLADPDQQSRTSVITLFCGIILARFGLWISDLSVTQLLQERVPESRRGAVSGVQSSLNMTMDTAKCLLVVAVPRASHFGLLIILSYLFWIVGWCFFLAYSLTTGRRPSPVLPESGSLTAANATTSAGNVLTPAAGPKTELAVPHEVQPLLDNGAAAVAAPNGHSPALDGASDPPPPAVVVDGDRDDQGSEGADVVAPPVAANGSTDEDGSPRAELKV